MTHRRLPSSWLGALVLIVGVAVSYLPALHAGFIWDDDSNVTDNVNLRDSDGLRRIWSDPTANQQYYPLTHTSFWMEYHLWGLNPFGYHLVNVVLHAASALVLWRILLLLGLPGAWFAAAIFAVHPLQVESVAWVTERKNTLSAVFFLAAVYFGLRFAAVAADGRRQGGVPASDSRRWWWYALCSGLFLCAVLAKSATCLLPVALAVLVWWKKGRVALRDLLPLFPLILLGATAGLHTAWLERHHVGAFGPEFAHSLAEKVLIAGRASWFYLGKLILPTGLCFIYPQWRIAATDATAYLYPAAALATLGGLWVMRGRIGRGPLAAALFFAVMIFPALGFFTVYFMRYSYVQDHFQYLAGIGPIVLFGALVARAHARVAERHLPASRLFAAAALVILLALGALTRHRSEVYTDAETIWRDTLAQNPVAWMAHNNLGVILRERGLIEQSVGHFREALRLRPDLAETWVNLGDALLVGGEIAQAVSHYRRAMELAPGLPGAHVGLGAALDRDGRAAAADEQFQEALRLDPDSVDARYHLARLRFRSGEMETAAAILEDLLRRTPTLAKAQTLSGDILAARGRAREAESHYREALRLRPNDPEGYHGLGVLLAAEGRLAAAAASLSRALAISPQFAEAHYNLGKVLDLQSARVEAVRHYRRAIEVNPGFAEAHNNLGVDLLLQGEVGAGTAHLREALRLKPGFQEARVNLEMSRVQP